MKGKNKNEQNDDTGDDLRGYGGVCRERCGRRQIDYVLGKRSAERTKNPSAYPQTSDAKFPANLTVHVGGKVALKRALPDDPADHRGILSWLAQPRKGYLRDAGSYGYLVEVKIPPEAVKEGKATIRLESNAGLAVYGPRFGRYPLGPFVSK